LEVARETLGSAWRSNPPYYVESKIMCQKGCTTRGLFLFFSFCTSIIINCTSY